jgi:hypothetical protein
MDMDDKGAARTTSIPITSRRGNPTGAAGQIPQARHRQTTPGGQLAANYAKEEGESSAAPAHLIFGMTSDGDNSPERRA